MPSFAPPLGVIHKRKRQIMTTSQTSQPHRTARGQSHMPDSPAPRDLIQEFANRIVSELENGVKPWVRPWDPAKAGGRRLRSIP